VVFAAFTAAIAPLVASVYGAPQLTDVVRVLAVVFLLVGLDSTQSALLDREMRFRVQAIRRLCATAASAAVAVTMAALGDGVWALVGQAITLEAVTVGVLWASTSWRPTRRFERAAFRELSAWGARYGAIRILWFLNGNADNFLIGAILGPLALGYYAIGYRVLVVINELVALTVTQVVLSTFAKLQNDREALNRAFYDSTLVTSALALPVYIGLAIAARPAVVFVFGSKWAHSVPVMQVLAFAGLVQCQMLFSHNYVIAIGRLTSELKWNIVVVALQVAGFAIAAPFGIVAVAASLGIVSAFAWPCRLWMLRSWGGLSFRRYFANYPRLIAAGAAMGAATLGVAAALRGSSAAVMLFSEAAVGALVYLLALRVLYPALFKNLLGLLAAARA
jgi:O-antigen/teichoic acid export membrane protein